MLRTGRGSKAQTLADDPQAIAAEQVNWTSIRNPLEREWLTGLWVIQELKLAAQAVIVVRDCELS